MATSSTLSLDGGAARLVITKQDTPEQEAIYKNGENKLLHSVIKNVPFVIELALVGEFDKQSINFNKCTLEATLMYDSREDKPVHYVSRRPVEYNCTVDKESVGGDKVKVECTLNVLSSQHEGAHFRLRFSAASLGLHVLSDPIRVVSKQLQLKKVKEQRKLAAAAEGKATASTATSKKRPLTDTIQDTLSRIEAQQQAQQTLIASLFQTVMTQLPLTPSAASSSSSSSSPSTPLSAFTTSTSSPVSSPYPTASPSAIFAQPAAPSQPPAKRRRVDCSVPSTPQGSTPASPVVDSPQTAFECHLRGLIESYHAITPGSRAQTVGSVVKSTPASHVETLVELVDVLCAEGLGRTSNIALGHLPRQPQRLSRSSSSSLVMLSSGADASDDDDACTETWLSTETSPSTSPMSPGESTTGGARSTFSFNDIGDAFVGGLTTSKLPTAMIGEFDDDDLYNELFSGQGWLLDEGKLPSLGGRRGGKDGFRGGTGEATTTTLTIPITITVIPTQPEGLWPPSVGTRCPITSSTMTKRLRRRNPRPQAPAQRTASAGQSRCTAGRCRPTRLNSLLPLSAIPRALLPHDDFSSIPTTSLHSFTRDIHPRADDPSAVRRFNFPSSFYLCHHHHHNHANNRSLTSHSSAKGSGDICLSALRCRKQGKDVNGGGCEEQQHGPGVVLMCAVVASGAQVVRSLRSAHPSRAQP